MQESRLSCVGKEELTYGSLRLSLHGKMPPAARHAAHWRQVDGVSNTVLSSALKELERDGLLERQEFLEVPVRVEYRPTERCRTLLPILEALSDWAEKDMK